jgi:hypothetical protein
MAVVAGTTRNSLQPHHLTFIPPNSRPGATVVFRGRACPLTPAQLALVRALWSQSLADQARPEPVRGFVSSCELIGLLSWDAPDPDFGHLKQLIRRVRRRIQMLGLTIESWQGIGYRLAIAAPPDWNRQPIAGTT